MVLAVGVVLRFPVPRRRSHRDNKSGAGAINPLHREATHTPSNLPLDNCGENRYNGFGRRNAVRE